MTHQKLNGLTLSDMKAINEEHGGHWFGSEEMKVFGTRVHGTTDKQGRFITSEWNFDKSRRLYTVRQFNPENGSISTVSAFNAYKSADEARKARKALQQQEV